MFYYLFDFLDREFDVVGAGVFRFISFRTGMAMVFSLLIAWFLGKYLIQFLRVQQIGETVRDLGLQGQMEKKGTPTMGGILIILCILIPTLLFAKLENIYIILLLISTIWLGVIGFLDDYIKVFKKNKEGLAGKFKIFGQVVLGLIVGLVLYFHHDVVVRHYDTGVVQDQTMLDTQEQTGTFQPVSEDYEDVKSHITTIPFVKGNELDYEELFGFLGEDFVWVLYVLLVIVVVTAVSNGANMTDGLDGLAAGTSAIIVFTLAVLAYVSGNTIFSNYLNIMFIPFSGEIVIYCGALVGACVGFLWFNSYPAQVFMGDTGSLTLGGIIAVLALTIRKELMIPILCGIFLIENVSVMAQVFWFKYTKRKYGEGRRIFLMSPLHHHYQKVGYHEAKIVSRFWIVGIFLAIITLATLKLR